MLCDGSNMVPCEKCCKNNIVCVFDEQHGKCTGCETCEECLEPSRPITNKACNSCRQAKVKCVPIQGGCKRCQGSGLQCKFSPKRARTSAAQRLHLASNPKRHDRKEGAAQCQDSTPFDSAFHQPRDNEYNSPTSALSQSSRGSSREGGFERPLQHTSNYVTHPRSAVPTEIQEQSAAENGIHKPEYAMPYQENAPAITDIHHMAPEDCAGFVGPILAGPGHDHMVPMMAPEYPTDFGEALPESWYYDGYPCWINTNGQLVLAGWSPESMWFSYTAWHDHETYF